MLSILEFLRLQNFQWYRKATGGTWYYNRVIVHCGMHALFYWERRKSIDLLNLANIKSEDYMYENKSIFRILVFILFNI